MSVQGQWSRAAVEHVDALCSGDQLDHSMRITLNFHPDRAARGVHILHAMAHECHYLSQFETGTSNGGLSAHPGGARWRWEQSIFGGAYDDAPAAERPKYGARPPPATARRGAALRLSARQVARAHARPRDLLLPRFRIVADPFRYGAPFRPAVPCAGA